jgi:hypothetical protein
MNKLLILVFGLFLALGSNAQPEEYELTNKIYKQNIRSVKFHLNGIMTSYPIVDLERPNVLELRFDDMEVDLKVFKYKIVHCNADWTVSDMLPIDFLDGFEEEEIREVNTSFNTARSNYTHYRLTIPNTDMTWNLSGNYVLLVWDDDDDSMVISRRFMVVEPMVFADIDLVRPADVAKFRTHHEFDFKINVKNIQVTNVEREITMVILQNGRWDNALTDIKPTFQRGDFLVYNEADKILFPAIKEFRNFDLRSVRYTNKNIFEIDRDEKAHYAVLSKQEIRKYKNYLLDQDLNGQYVIHNLDKDEIHTQSEYVNVLFNLVADEIDGHDIYVIGELTDWKLDERFRLGYDDEYGAYMAEIYLKQGFYDYLFVAVPHDQPEKMDFEMIEGNAFETENDYNFLVYYRPINERYDKLVGVFTFNPADR